MAKREAPPRRQTYHHGNLKEALVAAARKLIAERGPAGFTLAEAARLAGVSAAAPYRHFKDREALIGEIAQRGFMEFTARLRAVWKGVETDPLTGFGRMGDAYLAFAREEPGYYGAMFAGGGHTRRSRGESGFGQLEQAIAQILGGFGSPSGKGIDTRLLAYQVWAMSHGIATLSAAGFMPIDETAFRPQVLLREGVATLMRGIASEALASRRKPRLAPTRRSRKTNEKLHSPNQRNLR